MRGGKERISRERACCLILGPHVIDQALVLFGEPRAITASAFCERETSQVDDSFDVCLEYPRLRAMGRARIIAYAPGPHFLIHGTQGSFVKYGMDPQEARLRGENCPQGTDWGADWGVEAEELWGTLSLVGEPSVKVKTERGDYRGFYANVRDRDREEGAAGRNAGAGVAHHAGGDSGAQEQPGKAHCGMGRAGGVTEKQLVSTESEKARLHLQQRKAATIANFQSRFDLTS